MSHPITGDYVINFERNSFRVQLSAGYTSFASAQPKAQLALRTLSAALVPPTHMFDGVLGLPDRTASQVELLSHTD
ncbi:MAG: hypothetical protein FRX49_08795 [Trebouxia sp. A1-2]|nr:MAG: hypothetical protein FRX49_08795 [Trebouxia sp. A1-2]